MGTPKGQMPSRRVRGAEEGAVLDRHRTGRRVRARRKRGRGAGRSLAQRRGVAWVGDFSEKTSLPDIARPPAQCGPAGDGAVAKDPRRAHAPPDLGRCRERETPEREGEADRAGAVDAEAEHAARDDEEHGTATEAAVAPGGHRDHLGRLVRPRGAPELSLPPAVALQPDGAADGAARGAARGAPRRPRFGDRGGLLLPALDVDGALDDTLAASIPGHGNRSTTRGLSAKIRSPRRLFCGRHRAAAPLLRSAYPGAKRAWEQQ